MDELKSFQKELLKSLIEDLSFQEIYKDLLLHPGVLVSLYGVQAIDDVVYQTMSVNREYIPPAPDFNKAKTGKEQLKARLIKKKGKPSSLLSKLVNKT